MKKFLAYAPILMALATAAPAYSADEVTTNFINSKQEVIGTAHLKEVDGGTLISVDLTLPEGPHAIHIHQNASCEAPEFKTAGGHYNPTEAKHGFMSEEGFHAGDLPNLYVEKTGHIKADIYSARLLLSGDHSLTQGTSIIIHDKADDYSSDPSGDAGGRLACAVIKG